MGFITWMNNRSRLVKIIFAFPVIDIIWAFYRIVGACVGGFKPLRLILGIIWIIWGGVVGWILDIICIIVFNHICWWTK